MLEKAIVRRIKVWGISWLGEKLVAKFYQLLERQ